LPGRRVGARTLRIKAAPLVPITTMMSSARNAPARVLQRVRLASLAFACASVMSQLPLGIDPALPLADRVRGLAALAALLVLYGVTFLRGRRLPGEPVVLGAVILAAGTALLDPMVVIGLCIGAVVHQSLYGTTRAAVVRSAATAAGYLLTIALADAAARRGLDWNSGIVLGNLPGVVGVGALMRVLLAALVKSDLAAARHAILARTATTLLGQTDVAEIRRVGAATGAELVALRPDIGILRVEVGAGGLTVDNGNGAFKSARGATLPLAVVDGLDTTETDVQPLEDHTGALARLVGPRLHWNAILLPTTAAVRFVLIGAPKPLERDVLGAHRVLAAQVAMAEARATTHRELVHRAHHDALTGLANRATLYERVAATTTSGGGAVLHLDLDEFKVVNDTYGHTAGDELLVETARRLRDAAGEDACPARLGGDEFAVVLPGVTDPARAGEVAERVLAALAAPFRVRDAVVRVGVSIGVTQTATGLTAADVVRCADIAMYTAKNAGKGRVAHFDAAQHDRIARARTLEEHLPHATGRGEIGVHYQPQVDLATGRCLGIEALARWRHPRHGDVAPAEFIPAAERTGAIHAIGEHVLRTACAQAAEWSAVAGLEDLRLSVNVSARQLAGDELTGIVRSALADSGLAPERLTLELTESELLEGTTAVRQLVEIADLGVQIAIDDFGTGYASLAYLRALPVHQVKIDRSFVPAAEGAPEGADDLARAVLLVGQTLGLETVAEGVEHPEQADALQRAGVQIAQGFHFARPMPAADFPAWAAAQAASPAPAPGEPAAA
jgi:diguanylate cyclase (GGDEF)-like protein